jgi:hypothetical protein
LGEQYPNLGGLFLKFYGPKWVAPPLFWFRSAKSQQTKLAGKAAKVTQKLKYFLLEITENFCV